MRQLSRMGAALVVLLLGACSQAGAPPERPHSRTEAPASPSALASSSVSGPAASATLPCLDAPGSEAHPAAGLTVVLGVVALPTSETMGAALQTGLSGESDPNARLFAKQGLDVKTGATLEIVVPDEVVNGFSIGWGNPGRRTRRLVVDPCESSSPWLAWAGGYWVRQVGCLPLVVRAGGREEHVLIGVGAPCPGQRPPPQPTQT